MSGYATAPVYASQVVTGMYKAQQQDQLAHSIAFTQCMRSQSLCSLTARVLCLSSSCTDDFVTGRVFSSDMTKVTPSLQNYCHDANPALA